MATKPKAANIQVVEVQGSRFWSPFELFGGRQSPLLELWRKHYASLGISTLVRSAKNGKMQLLVHLEDDLRVWDRQITLERRRDEGSGGR